MSEIVQEISALVAIAGAATSFVFAIRAGRDTKIQKRMQLLSLREQYYSEFRRWADAGVEALTEAIFVCDLGAEAASGPEIFEKWLAIRQRLSTLVDQGRFFRPNESVGEHGQYKFSAYQGFRPPELDNLVKAYDLLDGFVQKPQAERQTLRNHLWLVRKKFVSRSQEILDPRGREEQVREMLDSV